MNCSRMALMCLVVSAAVAGSAFAQNQTPPSPPASSTTTMKDMGKGSGMSGMNMQQMMAHCTEMREQVKEKKPISADMQKMLKECDDMDRQMQMPSKTKSR